MGAKTTSVAIPPSESPSPLPESSGKTEKGGTTGLTGRFCRPKFSPVGFLPTTLFGIWFNVGFRPKSPSHGFSLTAF